MDLNNRKKYSLDNENYEIFITPEVRAYTAKFADPLTLNFKIMIDFNKPYGLFASENTTNSALAYLKRIGETVRYEALKRWISVFQIFIKNYDFLILNAEGIDTIVNAKPYDAFTENDKLTFTIRETSDMLVQSLLTQYRHIWYDNNRGVEVLPANLRRFDLGLLIYGSGYYNMAMYDVLENNDMQDDDIERKIFPTLKKLSDKHFVDLANSYDFNHHLIILGDAQINNEESGKSFFASITNEQSSEMVKNTLSLNYRFGSYKGIFNNIFGDTDLVHALSIAAAQDKFSNKAISDIEKAENKRKLFDTSGVFEDTINNLKKRPALYKKKLLAENSFIGNTLKNLTEPGRRKKMIKNTLDLGIQNIEDHFVYDNLARLNNMVSKSFSDNFIDKYSKYLPEDKKHLPSGIKHSDNMDANIKTNEPPQNVKYGVSNIYERKSF